MRYNNNTSSGHIKHPRKAYQGTYVDERKEREWEAKLNEYKRQNSKKKGSDQRP